MARLVREKDWSKTPLGSMDRWPKSLRALVDTLLSHPLPMILLWGPDLIQIYNDGWALIAGAKHPAALGQPNHECWPELRHYNEPIYERVLTCGEPVMLTDQLIPLDRHGLGSLEEAYFTVSYGPARDDAGTIGGIFVTVTETTGRVLAERERARLQAAEALRQTEERFRRAMNIDTVGVLFFGLDGRIHDANAAFERMSGYTLDELRATTDWAVLTVPEFLGPTSRTAEELATTGVAVPYEKQMVRKDGTRWWGLFAPTRLSGSGRDSQCVEFVIDTTERRRAGAAMRELTTKFERHSRLFEQIASTTPDFIYVFDLDGRFLYANRRLLEVWGRTFEDAVGKNLIELGYPQWHADMHMRELRQVIETKQSVKGEVPFTGGSGIFGIYEYIFTPVLGPDGEVEVIAGTTRDVTERKRAEAAQRESEMRFRTMADGLPLIVWVHGPDGQQEFVNRTFCEFFGVTEQEMRGGQWQLLMHPDDADAYREEFAACLRERRPFHAEVRVRRADGQWRWIESWGRPRLADSGEFLGLVGTSADVTERKRAEEALRDQEERVRAIFEQTEAGIAQVDLTGRFVLVNERYAQIVGRPREQLLGLRMQDITHADDLPGNLELLHKALGDGRPFVIEKRYVRPDGSLVWVNNSVSVMRGRDGRPSGVVAASVDITHRKRIEERLRTSEERLALSLSAADLGTFYCPIPLGRIEWNEKCKEHFWLPPDAEIDFDLFYSIIHPDDRERTRLAVERAVYGRGPYDIEYRTVAPDGRQRWIRARGRAYYDAAGNPVRFDGVTLDVTDRRQAEDALRDSERRFRDMADTAPAMLWVTEPDGYCSFLSRGWYEFTGQTVEEGLGFGWTNAVHPDDRAAAREAFVAANRDRAYCEIDCRMRRADGEYRWVIDAGRPRFGPGGEFLGFIGSVIDITDRKRAESRTVLLVALDDAVRSLADPEQVTAVAARLLGEHLGADRCAYADVEADEDTFNLTGDYTREGVPSIVGRYTFTDFGAEVLRLMREDKPFVVEDVDTHQPPVGDLTYYRRTMIQSVICVPLHKAGKFVAAMAVHQRVARRWTPDEIELVQAVAARCWESIERGRVMRALRQSEARFRQLADAMPQIVWAARPDGVLDYYNRRWFEYVDLPEQAVDEARWDRFVHPDDLPRASEAWQAALQSGGPYAIEFRVRNSGGVYRWFLVRAMPIRDEAGRVARWFGTCTDIDEQKLTRDALVLARHEAEAANAAKDKFLAVLSHELRTPLSPVVMTIPSLEIDPEMPFKFREDLAMVRRNIDLEVKLIDDLLDLSRVTSGKLRLQMQPVHAHELLLHVLRSSVSETSGKRLSVRHQLDASNDRLTADPARLQQVVWNLLRNAVKFTPDGGQITLRTRNDDGHLLMEVEDTGVGIDPDVLPRIFDAFEQGDARVARQFGGLGLGLAIAKAVVEMHGGTITAASEGTGRGATFTVRLATVAPTATTQPSTCGSEGNGKRGVGRPKVLLVEDHPDTARTLARLLQASSFEVRTADSVASALQLVAAEPFDIVVSDIGLPDATGYELMKQIRDRHGIKGIALSGYGMEEDMRKSREAGFVDHVVKPVNVDQLEAVITRVLTRPSEDVDRIM